MSGAAAGPINSRYSAPSMFDATQSSPSAPSVQDSMCGTRIPMAARCKPTADKDALGGAHHAPATAAPQTRECKSFSLVDTFDRSTERDADLLSF